MKHKRLLTVLSAVTTMAFSSFVTGQEFEFDIPKTDVNKPEKIAPQHNELKKAGAIEKKVKPSPVAVQKDKHPELYRVVPIVNETNPDKICKTSTVAMTFHNVPTQKGSYFHRWVSLGCEPDEINFVREGDDQYTMSWQLSYVPENSTQEARYALRWKLKGTNDNGEPVNYEARHTFNLDTGRTLSLTNNMAVSIRKVK